MKWIQLKSDEKNVDVIYLYDPNLPNVIETTDEVQSDWTYENGVWVSPEPVSSVEVPNSITRRQLLIGLTTEQIITTEEAIQAATSGTLPSLLNNIISSLSPTEQIGAKITWATMSVCEKNNQLLLAAMTALGKTPQDLDNFFIKYSKV